MRKLEFGRSMCFIRGDGVKVYPVKIDARSVGKYGFMVHPTHSNKTADATVTNSEVEVQRLVRQKGHRVRCRPLDGSDRANAYNDEGHSRLKVVDDLLV